MSPRRKVIWMRVKVSAPSGFTTAAIRREVRTLINDQANWAADPDDIKALAVEPASAPIRRETARQTKT